MIDYYNQAVKSMGAGKAAASLRLFAIPGNFQDDPFDKITVMEQWVEQGNVPGQIIGGYGARNQPSRTQLFCAYPKVARYKGTGDIDRVENYECAEKVATR